MIFGHKYGRADRHWIIISIACAVFTSAVVVVSVRTAMRYKEEYIRGGWEEQDAISRITALGGDVVLADRAPGWVRLVAIGDERILLKRVVAVSIPLHCNGVGEHSREVARELKRFRELESVRVFGSSHDDITCPPGTLDVRALQDAVPSASVTAILH